MNRIYNEVKKNPILSPLPMILGLIAFLIMIYSITITFRSLYDFFELKSNNIHSIFTSLFIHNLDDQGVHIFSNILALFLFGYIVCIQSSSRNMFIIFLLSGILTNLSTIFLVIILNNALTPRYVEWANSQGITVSGQLQLFGLSGGGASDGIMGLIGCSLAIAINFMLLMVIKIIQEGKNHNSSEIGQLIRKNYLLIILSLITLVIGSLSFLERFIADFECFSYSLTQLYAFGSGDGIPFPQSKGNSNLAHVIGTIIGFILGLWYLVISDETHLS